MAANDPNIICEDWWCLRCKVKFQCDNVPLTFEDNVDLENLNNSDSNKFLEMLPKFNIMSEIRNISNKAHDIDEIKSNQIKSNIFNHIKPTDIHNKLEKLITISLHNFKITSKEII